MTDQINRKRVQSARPFVERQRPLSSKPYHLEQKTEFIQKVYYNVPGLTERPSSGRNKIKINSLYTTKNSKFKESTQEKEVLIEQNLLLKKKVNMLEMQMSQLHGKMIVTRNKNSKNKKALDVEFQNQTLWAGKNSYLVTGVKNQYEKLKVQFRQKCQQLSQIKQRITYTRIEQLQKAYQKLESYSKELLDKNILLEQKINFFNSTSLASGSVSERNYRTSQLIIEDLKHKLAQKQQKLQKKKQQISKHNQNIEINNTRIRFLQKLALQKDNAIHALHTKNKKIQKQKQVYIEQITNLNKKLEETQKYSQQRISAILESQQRRVNKERNIYSNIIEEKNMTIVKLEKQVAYLTTLMSYWKPLDEQKRRNDSSIMEIKVVEVEQKKTEQDKNRKSTALGETLGVLGRAFSQRISQTNSVMRQKTEIQVVDRPRQQKRADVKRSDDAKKVRPVRQVEVEQIGELLRFKLIAKRVPISQVKVYFTKEVEQQLSIDGEIDKHFIWQNEYITMKQVQEILVREPFNLSESQAHLLSRYLIEDVQNDYLYWAWDNENKREVVKSILKNTIKDYEVNQSLQQIEDQTSVQLGKYRSRITTTLQQLYKDGFISKKKLTEIFVGSGFQLKQAVMEYIIGKLVLSSQSLDKLNYTVLF